MDPGVRRRLVTEWNEMKQRLEKLLWTKLNGELSRKILVQLRKQDIQGGEQQNLSENHFQRLIRHYIPSAPTILMTNSPKSNQKKNPTVVRRHLLHDAMMEAVNKDVGSHAQDNVNKEQVGNEPWMAMWNIDDESGNNNNPSQYAYQVQWQNHPDQYTSNSNGMVSLETFKKYF